MKKILLILTVFLIVLLCGGEQHVDLVIKRPCISNIAMGSDFECRGPDKNHLLCKGIVLTYTPSCAMLEVVK